MITGDHSWGRNLEECREDLEFIENLPGRKILLRGNHDMFWDAKKTARLNELFAGRLEFLQNNFYAYDEYALVGTKGYCYEGKDTIEHFEKLRSREIERLRVSFEMAKKAGYQKFIMVSALSADIDRRGRESVYPDGRAIWCRKGDLFTLPREGTVR